MFVVLDMINPPRRNVLKAVGTGAVVAGISTISASAEDPLQSQLDEVKTETDKYTDVGAALGDGFKPLGPAVCGMGWHFLNPARVGSAVKNGFERTEPQLLVYGQKDDGSLVLGSVEYALPVGARGYDEENPPDLFNDEESDMDATETWHVHQSRYHVFARPEDERRGEPGWQDIIDTTNWVEVHGDAVIADPDQNGPDKGDVVKADFDQDGHPEPRRAEIVANHPDLLTLHAWVHVNNNDGVFVPVNSKSVFAPDGCTPLHHE